MGYQGSRKARLQYLMQDADGTLAQVTDLSVLAEMLAIGGDVSDYSSTTDSLEALSNAIASIPTTTMRGTDNAFLAAVGGALDDAEASGAVTDVDTAMAYIKQLVTAIQLIPTTAMRGTDSAALASVLGALDTAVATGSISDAKMAMAYIKQLIVNSETNLHHSEYFVGDVWYVDASKADDTGTGHDPDTAKKTIGAALALMSAGDAVKIKQGTYTDVGLDFDLNGMEIWCESGVILDPASGTALTISGNSCVLRGIHKITPAAGAIGLLVSGDECTISDGKVLNGATNVRITGTGTTMNHYAAGFPTSIAYDIQGSQTRLLSCSTVGNAATVGYKISSGADTGVLSDCTSVGHTDAGYYIDTGSIEWTIVDCSSGAGDGKWIDVDELNVWPNFSYPEVATSTATLDANAETKSYNVAQIYGIVKIKDVHIKVLTALSSNITDFFLDIWDGSVSVPISKNTTLSIGGAPVGSLLTRLKDSTEVLDYQSGATAFITENSAYRDPQTEVIVGAKGDGTATYLRVTYTTSDAPSSGQIRGFFRWEPVNGDGFVQVL